MIWFRLALANLLLSPLTSAVNVLLMALGTASVVLLLLAGTQLSDTLARDARGVDLVIGAAGSPAQLILSAVYHADIPPGNIAYADAQRWADDDRVAAAAPLALGDSYRGFRIVGTTLAYPEILNAELAQGAYWTSSMQAVLGADVARIAGLSVGDRFYGAHGLSADSHSHDEQAYEVTGIVAERSTVLDRLILTSLDSVWELHEHDDEGHRADDHAEHDEQHADHDEDHADHDEDHADHDEEHEGSHGSEHDHEEDHHETDGNREITAMLLSYRTPLAAMSMPREVNAVGGLQAAAPATEISRLLQLVGLGLDGLRAFAWTLIVTACLSVFAALYGSLRSRRSDLAMLRCLGATRQELFMSLMSEGLLLSLCGVLLGFLIGHSTIAMVGAWLESRRGVSLSGWQWVSAETFLLGVLLIVSIASALLPAWQAYRTDVARSLAEATS